MIANPRTEQHTTLVQPKYRADVDGLRAIAVISVVGFHAFPNSIKGGFIGVDIFFVISGFLISCIIFGNLKSSSFSYAEFYARRVRRIFPALIVVLIACFALGWFVLLADEYKQLGKHMAAGAGFISNLVLWQESGYFDAASYTKLLLHLWSLGIEEQFYIFWPLLVGLVWTRKWNFLALMLLIAAASFALNIYYVDRDPVATFYSPFTRCWELMIGGILAYLALHKPQHLRYTPNWQSSAGVFLIALGLVYITKHDQFPSWWALLPTAGAFLLISAGPDAWLNRNLLGNRVLVWLGLISYPLYLWHWPLLSLARIVELPVPSREARVAAVVLSVILAWLTVKLVERPIRFGKNGGAVPLVCGLLMLMVLLAGYGTYAREGLAFRKIDRPPVFVYDWEQGYRYGQCFLDAKNSRSDSSSFAPYCSGIGNNSSPQPLVMVWGDSHAASLYRGLNHQSIDNFDLAQYTAAGCPPVVDFTVSSRKKCVEINRFVLSRIRELHPHTVILAAHWSRYNGAADGSEMLDYQKLKLTVQALRDQNIPNIVLVGHLPTFEVDQPKVGAKEFIANKVNRTYRNFNPVSAETNRKIKAFAGASGVAFVSPIDLLCNLEGCLISASSTELVPLAWDYGHLTEAGSRLLIEMALQKQMFYLPRRSVN